MDKELQNFISKASNVKMTAQEKSLLKSKLAALPISSVPIIKSPYLSKSHFWTLGKALVAACLIVILSGGSLAAAAEQSLPGEFLYPIKTDFNEEIVSIVKRSPEAKIAWQEKRFERREQEIKKLKEKNKLNDRARTIIERNFDRQIKKIDEIKIKTKTGPQKGAGHQRKDRKN